MTDMTEKDLAKVPFLTVVENGCGSPCIDFRQVSSELASLAEDTDLVVLEGMVVHYIPISMPSLSVTF
jgi:uncharacterized protein with ATP-grasp and redox domains